MVFRAQQKSRHGVRLAGYVNVSREMDSNLNVSPEMSQGLLECGVALLQNFLLMIF